MTIIFRTTDEFLHRVRRDLQRPHPFAHERVGFVTVRASKGGQHLLLLTEDYHPVADEDYMPDDSVGARIGQEALRKALEIALRKPVGVFHIHMHTFPEQRLWFSWTDLSEQMKFVPDFFKIRRDMPHGAIVLSPTSAAGRAWLSPDEIVPIGEFNIVGAQLQILRAHHNGSVDFEA